MMPSLAELTFLRPLALWLFVALPLVFWRMQRHAGGGSNPWRGVVDPALMPLLFPQAPEQTRLRSRPQPRTVLACLGWSLATLALSGPSLHEAEVPTVTPRSETVIALGLSPSMLAEDLTPNRLTRSRIAIEEWLQHHDGEEIGLIAFAGSAFRVSPLTRDTDTLIHLLTTLGPDVMPRPGADIAAATRAAAALFSDTPGPRTVLLVTDGALSPSAQGELATLRRRGVRIQVIGVGTPSGAPIPLANGRFATGRDGQLKLATVDLREQQRAVESIGGSWADVRRFDGRMWDTGASGPHGRSDDDAIRSSVAQDDGIWLLFPLMLIVALGFRRGSLWVVLLATTPLLAPAPVLAADVPAWLLNREQRALRAWRENPGPETAEAIPDPAWRGTAEFLGGDFAAAEQSFAGGASAADKYNHALSLAHQDRLDEAIAGFRELVQEHPDFTDAQKNLDLLEKIREQQQQQDSAGEQGTDKQDGESGENSDDAPSDDGSPSAADSESSDQGQRGEDPGEPGSPQNGDSGQDGEDPAASENNPTDDASAKDAQDVPREQQPGTEESTDTDTAESTSLTANPAEQEEAERTLRQWLRRVDSDPARLLRERFRRLELERQRGAQGKDS